MKFTQSMIQTLPRPVPVKASITTASYPDDKVKVAMIPMPTSVTLSHLSETKPLNSIPNIDALHTYLENKYSKQEVTPPMEPGKVYIRASSIYDLCPRMEFLVAKFGLNRTRIVESSGNLRMAFGTELHTWLQNDVFRTVLMGAWTCKTCNTTFGDATNHIHIPDKCPSCGSDKFEFAEMKLKDTELCLGGHADGFLQFPDQEAVIDFKSISTEGYEGLDKWGISKRYIWQANTYLLLSGLELFYLIYVNKNIPEFKFVEVKKDSTIIATIRERCATTIVAINSLSTSTPTIPERNVCDVATCTKAKVCPVRDECFKYSKTKSVII